MTDGIDVPGGEVLLGLTPEEVERLVRLNVEHNKRFLEDDHDRARWSYDLQWYEKLGGNAEALRPLLTALCPLRKVVIKPFRLARRRFCSASTKSSAASIPRITQSPTNSSTACRQRKHGRMRPGRATGCRASPNGNGRRGAARGVFSPWGPDWSSGADGFMHSASWVTGWAPGSRPGLASPEGFLDMVTGHGEWCSEGMLMGASPHHLLPNAAILFEGPMGPSRYGRIRLAQDA